MIVIKYKNKRIEGFEVNRFWFDTNEFYYVGNIEVNSIPIENVREILVDGTTIYQSEVA